ncbi:MAG: hypothetical protein VKJ46_03045 [Leptolyngbyaceae bacterium]|nr:hypothetical protein [Leptolyngbyaceae bacterium]
MFASQSNPPQFVELLMLLLAIALLLVWGIADAVWGMRAGWPYLVLSLSYAIGSAVSTLVRETILPSPQPRLTQVIAVLLLLVSLYSFTDFLRYF